MHYMYIIRSMLEPKQTYTGYTQNIKKRISDHNSGNSFHTAKYKPWKLELFFGFKNKNTALEFEKYLKSHSSRAFAAKRLIPL